MKTTDKYQQLVHANKDKENKMKTEAFCVEIKLPSQPHILRLTYSKYKGGKIVSIEEISALDEIISSGTFRGKTHTGNLPQDILELKSLFNQIKVSDWYENPDVLIDAYYKYH